VEDGNLRILSKPDIKHGYPVCSPDGTTIAYIGPMGEKSTIWLMDVNGENKRPLVDGCRPAWSPDSKQLAFAAGSDIWVVKANGSGLRQLTSGPGLRSDPKWSPDGNLIAFQSWNTIWLMNPDGSNQRPLTETVSEPGYAVMERDGFSWSYDGKRIFYTYRPIPADDRPRTYDGAVIPYEVWAVNIDGSDRHCLTPNDVSCGRPVCVPGQRRVAYLSVYSFVVTARQTSRVSYPDQNIWMLDLVEKKKEQLTDIGQRTEFAVSLGDGTIGKTTLDLRPKAIHEFAISPDSRRLVFTTGLYLFVLEM